MMSPQNGPGMDGLKPQTKALCQMLLKDFPDLALVQPTPDNFGLRFHLGDKNDSFVITVSDNRSDPRESGLVVQVRAHLTPTLRERNFQLNEFLEMLAPGSAESLEITAQNLSSVLQALMPNPAGELLSRLQLHGDNDFQIDSEVERHWRDATKRVGNIPFDEFLKELE